MAKSVNKVFLIGNVGKDPEVKYTPSGVPVATFSLACSERFKTKAGDWEDRTEWVNVKAWQRSAEIVGEYVKRGSRVFVEGRLNTETWETKGEKKYKTVVVVTEILLLDSRNGDSAERATPARHVTDEELGRSAEITDDDIPF